MRPVTRTQLFVPLVLFFMSCSGWVESLAEPADLVFLPIGQGSACLYISAQGNMLFDAGPDSTPLSSMLREQGVDSLAGVVISHWDRDHAGGLATLLKSGFPLGSIHVGPDRDSYPWGDSIATLAHQMRIPLDTLWRGDTLPWNGPTARILWPPKPRTESEEQELTGNSASLVVRIAEGTTSALLPGDIGVSEEMELLSLEANPGADLLVLAHHGSRNSSSLAFLAAVYPRWVVVQVGANNEYGHPHTETLDRLYLVRGDSNHVLISNEFRQVAFRWWPPDPPWPADSL